MLQGKSCAVGLQIWKLLARRAESEELAAGGDRGRGCGGCRASCSQAVGSAAVSKAWLAHRGD